MQGFFFKIFFNCVVGDVGVYGCVHVVWELLNSVRSKSLWHITQRALSRYGSIHQQTVESKFNIMHQRRSSTHEEVCPP